MVFKILMSVDTNSQHNVHTGAYLVVFIKINLNQKVLKIFFSCILCIYNIIVDFLLYKWMLGVQVETMTEQALKASSVRAHA